MRGLMQEWPLLVHTFIDHAKIHHGEREIVSRKVEGDIHSTTYSEIYFQIFYLSKLYWFYFARLQLEGKLILTPLLY